MTRHQAILYGEEVLRSHGVEQPRWNAERLLCLALKEDRARLYAELGREISGVHRQMYYELLQRRSEHYPLAYLEGTQEFLGRNFHVREGVLIPRPETEEVIRAVLEMKLDPRPLILDLGSGSGCIAVTLALKIPGSIVVAMEMSAEAVPILRQNLVDAVFPVRGDFETAPFLSGRFDLIVSNPPYVEESSYRSLPPETRWEPRLALVTANLEETYRGILLLSERLLKPGGRLVFEIGFGQDERIREVCAAFKRFSILHIRKDYREIPRTFVLQKLQ